MMTLMEFCEEDTMKTTDAIIIMKNYLHEHRVEMSFNEIEALEKLIYTVEYLREANRREK